jgi:hypothetical protein
MLIGGVECSAGAPWRIVGAAGDDAQVGQHVDDARAVGVTAQHGHARVGVRDHRRTEHLADRGAGEERQPVVVGDRALVPARVAERRHVGRDHDVPRPGQGLGDGRRQRRRGLVAQRAQRRRPGGLRQPGQLGDVDEVAEEHPRAREIAEAAVAPAIVADERGLGVEADHASGRQPAQVRVALRQRARLGAHGRDRRAVEVVVAEDEPHRTRQRGGQRFELGDHGGASRDVAGHDHAVGRSGDDGLRQRGDLGRGHEVEVEIGQPRQPHAAT